MFEALLGPLLGTLLEAMLGQNGLLKLSKVTFFDFLTPPRSLHFSVVFWKAFRTLLGPSWARFELDLGKLFKAKIHANIDLDEDVRMVFSPRRESNLS